MSVFRGGVRFNRPPYFSRTGYPPTGGKLRRLKVVPARVITYAIYHHRRVEMKAFGCKIPAELVISSLFFVTGNLPSSPHLWNALAPRPRAPGATATFGVGRQAAGGSDNIWLGVLVALTPN